LAKQKLDENFVAEEIRKLIEALGVSATVEVSSQNGIFFIDIDSPDSALLIGKHGVNLESLQFVLAVRIKTLTNLDDFEVFVDVNSWRKQKEERLKQMAHTLASKVAQSKTNEVLYNLKSSERRVIHTALTDHPDVVTLSEGEGLQRILVISPKNAGS